jgi:hypothetical protein
MSGSIIFKKKNVNKKLFLLVPKKKEDYFAN